MEEQDNAIWNRACTGAHLSNNLGDTALFWLLRAHGLAMNGGVLHVVECLSCEELNGSVEAYRFFDLEAAALLLMRVQEISNKGEDLEEYEEVLDQEYSQIIPDDDLLVSIFRSHRRLNPSAYSPA